MCSIKRQSLPRLIKAGKDLKLFLFVLIANITSPSPSYQLYVSRSADYSTTSPLSLVPEFILLLLYLRAFENGDFSLQECAHLPNVGKLTWPWPVERLSNRLETCLPRIGSVPSFPSQELPSNIIIITTVLLLPFESSYLRSSPLLQSPAAKGHFANQESHV